MRTDPWTAGPTPEQQRRWAAERELLARRDTARTSDRVRVTVWVGFVLTCAAVIVVCVVAVLGSGGSFAPADGAPETVVSAGPTAPR